MIEMASWHAGRARGGMSGGGRVIIHSIYFPPPFTTNSSLYRIAKSRLIDDLPKAKMVDRKSEGFGSLQKNKWPRQRLLLAFSTATSSTLSLIVQ
jgi:hypothetical protein